MIPATGTGTYQLGETVYQGYSKETAIASGIVTGWANNLLSITSINGNFISSKPMIGVKTNASYYYSSYNLMPGKFAEIDITPNPLTANANSAYTYTKVTTEYR
mgnify:CR=1 FL=1